MSNEKQKKPENLRGKIGKQIVFYNLALIVISIIFFILKGFDQEEFTTLVGLLGPITAVYVGTLFRYIGSDLEQTQELAPISQTYSLLRWIIPLHFLLLLGLISSKALFNVLPFEDLTLIFAFVETSFGGYVGFIISSLFPTVISKSS